MRHGCQISRPYYGSAHSTPHATYSSAQSHFSDLEYERYHTPYGSHSPEGTQPSVATEHHRWDHDAVVRDAYQQGGFRYGGVRQGHGGQISRPYYGSANSTPPATYSSAQSHFSDLEYERYHTPYGSHSPDGNQPSAATEYHRWDHDASGRDASRHGAWGRHGQSGTIQYGSQLAAMGAPNMQRW
jgi:hypothetical protein